jgi:2-aminoadipate transaminase
VLDKLNLGKQAADLCTSTLSQLLVSTYFEHGRWQDYVESLTAIYRARRDTMLDALERCFPEQAEWTRPAGGLFIWVTLPDFIDTTDLLARALQENVAFVPGEGAYMDGRGRSSMRLNFSGVDENEIREGVRRLGEIVQEQVELYGTLTGERKAPAAARRAAAAEPPPDEGGRVVQMPSRRSGEERARRG